MHGTEALASPEKGIAATVGQVLRDTNMVGYENGGFKLFGDNNVISSRAPGSQGVLERARTNALALLS